MQTIYKIREFKITIDTVGLWTVATLESGDYVAKKVQKITRKFADEKSAIYFMMKIIKLYRKRYNTYREAYAKNYYKIQY